MTPPQGWRMLLAETIVWSLFGAVTFIVGMILVHLMGCAAVDRIGQLEASVASAEANIESLSVTVGGAGDGPSAWLLAGSAPLAVYLGFRKARGGSFGPSVRKNAKV